LDKKAEQTTSGVSLQLGSGSYQFSYSL
jgi:hypothetical protein